jgi:hypothetical protein
MSLVYFRRCVRYGRAPMTCALTMPMRPDDLPVGGEGVRAI